MSPSKKPEFLMDADFQCLCGSIMGVRVSLPVVKATGVEVTCSICRARYLVTESGAVPTDQHISGSVHSGHFAWDPTVTREPLLGDVDAVASDGPEWSDAADHDSDSGGAETDASVH